MANAIPSPDRRHGTITPDDISTMSYWEANVSRYRYRIIEAWDGEAGEFTMVTRRGDGREAVALSDRSDDHATHLITPEGSRWLVRGRDRRDEVPYRTLQDALQAICPADTQEADWFAE